MNIDDMTPDQVADYAAHMRAKSELRDMGRVLRLREDSEPGYIARTAAAAEGDPWYLWNEIYRGAAGARLFQDPEDGQWRLSSDEHPSAIAI